MLDFITGLFGGIWGYLAAGVGIVAALFGARLSGRRAERKDREIDDLKARVRREEIEDEIDNDSPADRRDSLGQWVRDD